MALRPPGNSQWLLRRALAAINTLCHPGRDTHMLTPPPPSSPLPKLVLEPASPSVFSNFAAPGSPVLPTLLEHGRAFSSSGGCIKATLFPGDGIGPEIADSVKKLVKNPGLFDVLVVCNLYGDIISDLCAGLIRGSGLTPSGNIGDNGLALMEAMHGTAPNIAGKNLANPTVIFLSSAMMSQHVNMTKLAEMIDKSILKTIAEWKYKTHPWRSATCTNYTKALIDNHGL